MGLLRAGGEWQRSSVAVLQMLYRPLDVCPFVAHYVDPVAAHVFGFKLKNRHNTAWHRHEKVNYTLKGPTQTNIMQRIG